MNSTKLKDLNQHITTTSQIQIQLDNPIQWQIKKQLWSLVWAENPLIYFTNPLLVFEARNGSYIKQVWEQVDNQLNINGIPSNEFN